MTSHTTAAAPTGSRQYWAFISYSHADEAWARWLHRSLERYRVPGRLVGRPHSFGKVPKHLRPIFRDRDDLVSSPELSTAIHQALVNSKELIVVCSPSAAASPYVNEEVRQFKSLGRGSHIRCLIVDGQPARGPADCFPPALRSGATDSPEGATPIEPLAADVRRGKDGKSQALLKVLAGILDLPYDELRRREQRRNRQRMTIAAVSGVILLGFLFLILSDAGLRLPFGESARVWLDRAGVTLFRPVYDAKQVADAATHLRSRVIPMLRARQRESGMYSWGAKDGDGVDSWATAQVLGALSQAPETTASDWPSLRRAIDALFSKTYWSSEKGPPKGWIFRPGRPPNGNVALWVVAALTEVIAQDGLVPAADRSAVLEYYQRAVEVAAQLSPRGDGGWNMLASQDDPEYHNFYTSALALQALLGAHRTGLPWAGGEPPLQPLSRTARWLVAGFDGADRNPGWRRTLVDNDPTLDGLTLQIYALLVQAEQVGAIALPGDLFDHMTRHLVSLVDRGHADQPSSAEFDPSVNGKEENESVVLLWYPWAIRAAELWLERSSSVAAAPENVTRVRRSLGHLLVNEGDGVVDMNAGEHTFRAAELLWNLARIER